MQSGLQFHHVGIPASRSDRGKEVVIEPSSPSPGVTVAFIVENDAK
jgi:hypothetical protein